MDSYLLGFWDSAFATNRLLQTNEPFAKKLGLEGCVIPSTLLTTIALRSLSITPRLLHSDIPVMNYVLPF